MRKGIWVFAELWITVPHDLFLKQIKLICCQIKSHPLAFIPTKKKCNKKNLLSNLRLSCTWTILACLTPSRRFKQYQPLREDHGSEGSFAVTSVPLLLWNLLSRQSPGESRPLLQGRVVWKSSPVCALNMNSICWHIGSMYVTLSVVMLHFEPWNQNHLSWVKQPHLRPMDQD